MRSKFPTPTSNLSLSPSRWLGHLSQRSAVRGESRRDHAPAVTSLSRFFQLPNHLWASALCGGERTCLASTAYKPWWANFVTFRKWFFLTFITEHFGIVRHVTWLFYRNLIFNEVHLYKVLWSKKFCFSGILDFIKTSCQIPENLYFYLFFWLFRVYFGFICCFTFQVFIIGHVPPGAFERAPRKKWFYPQFNKRYIAVVLKHADVITGHFLAHQHCDSFKIFYDNKGRKW